MNQLQKIQTTKRTENGDVSYKTTGDNLTDLFFMTSFFEKNLEQVHIGNSPKEQLFSMFIRDPRYGLGRRDLGRKLLELSKVKPQDIVLCGRYDDLWNIPTDDNISFLHSKVYSGDNLAKKWMPRLTGKDKKIAKALCKEWGLSEKLYRKLIKCDNTVEYKLSYAEKDLDITELNHLFEKYTYKHPLVDEIDFEKVPSLAMIKYLNTFNTREDLKGRFAEYLLNVKENKAKVNTSTATVYDAFKTTKNLNNDASDVIGKKIVDNATLGVELDCIVILDSSGSMGWLGRGGIIDKAFSVAHALSTHSTYAKNQLISFSSKPQLMEIKGNTLAKQYQSMYTGDCSNTDFGKVMKLLQQLKRYPEYIVVLSDMEFDEGSNQSKKQTMKLFKELGAETKIIWWNFNDRNKTVPEVDEYGNIYLSGYNMQILKLLENKFDMSAYIEKLLLDYAYKIDKIKEI